VIRLAIRVRRADAELVLAELLELAPSGIEEVDHGDVVEYAVYGAPGELPALPDLRAAAGESLVEVSTSEIADDWDQRWREFHQPITVAGGRLTVRAPWHATKCSVPVVADGTRGTEPFVAQVVVIDPGQAFGTGAHATTRLCLETLCELEPGGPLVDVGCGSGVLAIAAHALGWGPLLALDNDPAAVAATLENAAANGAPVEARRFDLRAEPVPEAPTVVANLVRPLLAELRFAAPPRTLIAGGLLDHEGDEAAAGLARHGLREVSRRSADGWVALVLRRG
jgi:ribosomal protein L11 methyltransferase